MALTGYLAEFSLPEIFQFVEQGYKTGLLTIQTDIDASNSPDHVYYLWIKDGRIVAMADERDNNRLLSMMERRGWLNSQTQSLLSEWSKVEQPLGLYLKSQGAMTAEQLKLLFHAQVLQRVCTLFKLSDGKFAFDSKAKLPVAEMTGLSLSASEASLLGLRVLRDWTTLAPKLPDPSFGLNKIISGTPHLQLNPQEWQVWEFADGSASISAIAKQLQLSVEIVQQIAFRMTIVGLIEEVPIIVAESKKEPVKEQIETAMPELVTASTESKGLNQSFLQNLMGFLKVRAA